MRGSQKLKRVSWATGVNLCQVRLFLSEDSPSQVGSIAQDHLQAKTSWLLHSTGTGSDDQLPPGFEDGHSVNQLKKEMSQIPLVKWQCPPKVVLNPVWQVVSGEESKEVDVQNQREMRVLEAVYPRLSAIPPSPSVSLELEDSHYDDRHIPLIPIIPIEDEDVVDPSSDLRVPNKIPVSSQLPLMPQRFIASSGMVQTSQGNIPVASKPLADEKPAVGATLGVEPDVVAAASAAFTAIMTSNEQGNLIDHELLIKILNNPKLIEKFGTDYAKPTNPLTVPKPRSPPISMSVPHSVPPVNISRIEPDVSLSAAPISGQFPALTNAVTPTLQPRPPPGIVQISTPAVKAPPLKDANYYKSLIQQHGGEKTEAQDQTLSQFGNRHNHHHQRPGVNPEMVQSSKPRDSKPKIMKPCIYFNSSRGCKHGANCAYQHDTTAQQRIGTMPEAQSAKRMKLDREITGRT